MIQKVGIWVLEVVFRFRWPILYVLGVWLVTWWIQRWIAGWEHAAKILR